MWELNTQLLNLLGFCWTLFLQSVEILKQNIVSSVWYFFLSLGISKLLLFQHELIFQFPQLWVIVNSVRIVVLFEITLNLTPQLLNLLLKFFDPPIPLIHPLLPLLLNPPNFPFLLPQTLPIQIFPLFQLFLNFPPLLISLSYLWNQFLIILQKFLEVVVWGLN